MSTFRAILVILMLFFTLLCFIGIFYVLINRGTVNPGYAIIPFLCALVCSVLRELTAKKE